MDRRKFLKNSFGANLLAGVPASFLASKVSAATTEDWDAGSVQHILPTVSDTRMLIKVSFSTPLSEAPVLAIDNNQVTGQMNDTQGEFWQFYAAELDPGRTYTLQLNDTSGTSLCEPWNLATFPEADSRQESFRVMMYTCAGGDERLNVRSNDVRRRLLRRGLSYGPQAVAAIGDHVYWDLPNAGPGLGSGRRRANRVEATGISQQFDRDDRVFGTDNEDLLKLVASPQIIPIYGTDFRSTPVFFLQDDHDHYSNDEASDIVVTFPPSWFMIQLARATQKMLYPEFLPDANRAQFLPWSSAGDRITGLSESFGTIRYGDLAEVLLYDVRRTMTIRGPSSVFIDRRAEDWLHDRTNSSDTRHLVHIPSNPMGWSAGKWAEWYPDVLGDDDELTTSIAKPYWQQGWLSQHDRLVASLGAMNERTPMIVSGDLHALAKGKMLRSGSHSFESNPIHTILSGPPGTGGAWPSRVRGVLPSVPGHLDFEEEMVPIEENGFMLIDFMRDKTVLNFFRWNIDTQLPEEIDSLEPFHTEEILRPV